jgi:hypothetical protein
MLRFAVPNKAENCKHHSYDAPPHLRFARRIASIPKRHSGKQKFATGRQKCERRTGKVGGRAMF